MSVPRLSTFLCTITHNYTLNYPIKKKTDTHIENCRHTHIYRCTQIHRFFFLNQPFLHARLCWCEHIGVFRWVRVCKNDVTKCRRADKSRVWIIILFLKRYRQSWIQIETLLYFFIVQNIIEESLYTVKQAVISAFLLLSTTEDVQYTIVVMLGMAKLHFTQL